MFKTLTKEDRLYPWPHSMVTYYYMCYDTFSKKHDIKREVHRQENFQNTHGVGENKKNPATSLLSYDKKGRKMLNSVQVGIKNHISFVEIIDQCYVQ